MADILHIGDRFPASRVTVLQVLVVLALGQQGQVLAHISPAVRVSAQLFGQHAGIFEVAIADVVGGQRHPGAVWLADALGDLVAGLGEVARATVDTLNGVEAVYPHFPGGGAGQHHQAAHAGGGLGAGVPVGLLVTQGRQQFPVQLVLVRRFLQLFTPLGQALAGELSEGLCAAHVHFADVAEIQLAQLCHQTSGIGPQHKVARRPVQGVVIAFGEGPGNRLELGQVKGDVGIRVEAAVNRVSIGVHDGVVVFALVDHLHQFHGVHIGNFFPIEALVAARELAQLLAVGTASDHRNVFTGQIGHAAGARLAEAIDDLLADLEVGGGKADLFAALRGYREARSGQVGAGLRVIQLAEQVAQIVHVTDFELNTQLPGKCAQHAVLKAGVIAVGVFVIGGGSIL